MMKVAGKEAKIITGIKWGSRRQGGRIDQRSQLVRTRSAADLNATENLSDTLMSSASHSTCAGLTSVSARDLLNVRRFQAALSCYSSDPGDTSFASSADFQHFRQQP